MLMRTMGLILAALLLAVFAAGCGGGGATAAPGDGQGDNPPGMVGDISAPPAPGDFPQAQPITGEWPDAPLGTTAAYDVRPAGADLVDHSASKAASTLDPGQPFGIQAATIALPGVALGDLNWDATNLSFTEGAKVKLWLRYEIAPTFSYVRSWRIAETDLDYSEAAIDDPTGGVYTVSFDYSLPFLSGTDATQALYEAVLALPKVGSAVIIVTPGGNGEVKAQVPFTITKVPTDPFQYSTQDAQMGWEDLIVNSDYDYNDFVAHMRVTEHRRHDNNKLVQIDLWVKAIARGAGYDGSWQFNMDGAFPSATAVAYVQQYYANGTPHGGQRIWTSKDGTSIPVFTSNKEACVKPPESFATNTVKGSTFIEGDYADVTILFDTPLDYGTYTPMPYKPQLRVFANNGSVYIVGLWTRRGDPVDANGRPLAFIIPDTYAWPLEGRQIWIGYPRFNDWVYWVNHLELGDNVQPDFWNDAPEKMSGSTYNVFDRSLFK
jgi:hypothetical protein